MKRRKNKTKRNERYKVDKQKKIRRQFYFNLTTFFFESKQENYKEKHVKTHYNYYYKLQHSETV